MAVQTLVELYDERPLENVLGVEIFRPERVIYVCPNDLPKEAPDQLRNYFSHRGLTAELHFVHVNLYDTRAIVAVFEQILASNPRDLTLDITGGTDAVLFAAGLACDGKDVPVVTYSRTRNRFYSIQHAGQEEYPCEVSLSVEDCFRMAGGTMRQGRVDNAVLSRYREDIGPFFALYLRHRKRWDRTVTYIQRLSAADAEGNYTLQAEGAYHVKGERGSRISAPEEALREMEEIGLIADLVILPEERVSFRFRDDQIRTWLRDVGSVLELYVYQTCLDSGIFNDVRISAVVDWRESEKRDAVSNELDVVCTRGIIPAFISCKTCMIHTEALNELAILRDRFGGEMAQAAIVSAEYARATARNRAAELGIRVIDLGDLEKGRLEELLRRMMRIPKHQ